MDQAAIETRRQQALADARKYMQIFKAFVDNAAAQLASPGAERGFTGEDRLATALAYLPELTEALLSAVNGSLEGRFRVRDARQHQLPCDRVAVDEAGQRVLENVYTGARTTLDRVLEYAPVGSRVSVAVRTWEPLCEDGINTVAAIAEFKAALAAPDFRHVSRRHYGETGPEHLCVYRHAAESPTGCLLMTSVRATDYTRSLVQGTICAGGCMGSR